MSLLSVGGRRREGGLDACELAGVAVDEIRQPLVGDVAGALNARPYAGVRGIVDAGDDGRLVDHDSGRRSSLPSIGADAAQSAERRNRVGHVGIGAGGVLLEVGPAVAIGIAGRPLGEVAEICLLPRVGQAVAVGVEVRRRSRTRPCRARSRGKSSLMPGSTTPASTAGAAGPKRVVAARPRR